MGRRVIISLATMVVLFSMGGGAWGIDPDYYVSPDGNDDWNGEYPTYQGGVDGPKATIQAGIGIAGSGSDDNYKIIHVLNNNGEAYTYDVNQTILVNQYSYQEIIFYENVVVQAGNYFDCPCGLFGCGDCEAEAPDSPDDCGNTLTITCNNDSGSCCFQYWYNSTEVGKCVWKGGRNIFEYKITANGERFLKTEQYSCNDKRGVDSDGEGCEGYFCWRRVTFDCVDTSATPQVTWRKQDLEECPCGPGSHPGIGEECLGEDGDHPGHPN